ncbi:hypothetical protein OROGR_027266 [Orobanche gracilis]
MATETMKPKAEICFSEMEDPDAPATVVVSFLVNKQNKKVIFAQAKKDFLDILAGFLSYPLGTLSDLVGEENTVGSITVLRDCLETFNGSFFWNGNKAKSMLLHPPNSAAKHFRYLAVKLEKPAEYYLCLRHYSASRSMPSTSKCTCENWKLLLDVPGEGFVKSDDTIYIITDDLNVRPFSAMCSSINFRRDTNVVLYEKLEMVLTKSEVQELLWLAICSKNPLSDLVFGHQYRELPEGWSGVLDSNCWVLGEPNNINIRIKIMVDKKANTLLFAYCNSDFLDVLLSFLTFPLGAVVNAFGRRTSLGSIDTLYESIHKLYESNLDDHSNLHTVLYPRIAVEVSSNNTIFPIEETRTSLHFRGNYSPQNYLGREKLVSYSLVEELSESHHPPDFQEVSLQFDSARKAGKGFLKESFVYIVEPDLNFERISPVFDIGFPEHFAVDISHVQEKHISIGINEFLMILKASLTSSSKPLDDALKHLFPGLDGGESDTDSRL